MDTITVQSQRDNVTWQGKMIDYFTGVGLGWVADWLGEISQSGGRIPKVIMARCAEELAATIKEHTGKSDWDKVGEIVAAHFGMNPNNPREWIDGIVKRNRRRTKKMAAERKRQLSELKKVGK